MAAGSSCSRRWNGSTGWRASSRRHRAHPKIWRQQAVGAWAWLIARIYEVDPLRCRRCGGTLQLIALIVESAAIVRSLDHLGEPSRAPRMAPIRGPPGAGETWDGMPDNEDQRQDVSW